MQLIHAQYRWKDAITTALWPYALRYYNNVHNYTTTKGRTESPMEAFARTKVKPRPKHFHAFGCPVYVLKNELQSNKHLPKWAARSRVGIYLGLSQRHARSVSLVLSLETGVVSPQYHVYHDDMFETVKQQRLPSSMWQYKCHYEKQQRGRNQCQEATESTEQHEATDKQSPKNEGDDRNHEA